MYLDSRILSLDLAGTKHFTSSDYGGCNISSYHCKLLSWCFEEDFMTDEELDALIEKKVRAALKRVLERISRIPMGWGVKAILKQVAEAIDSE